MEVLVTGPSVLGAKDAAAGRPTVQMSARTRGDHIVVFQGKITQAGRYVIAEIVGATALTLFGELRPDEPA